LFDRILGLPAHALIVHSAVVLIPMLALGAILYAVVPPLRRHFRWPLVLFAIAAPLAAWAAKMSGDVLSKNKILQAPEMQAKISQHQSFGTTTEYVVLGLGVAVLLLAFTAPVTRRVSATRQATDDTLVVPKRGFGEMLAVQIVVGVVVIGLAAASLYYVFRTGDSGAHMIWSGY
jgi:hypothetical protein